MKTTVNITLLTDKKSGFPYIENTHANTLVYTTIDYYVPFDQLCVIAPNRNRGESLL